MRLEQLNYLIAIEEYHSMNKASEKIYVSQQSISNAILELEKELGFELVNRTNRGSFLTAAGKDLVRITKEFYEKYDELKQLYCHVADADNRITQLHFLFESSMVSFWETLYMRYIMDYPDIALKKTYITYDEIEERLDANPNSIAIVCVDEETLERFKQYHYQIIKKQSLSLYVSKNSYLVNNKSLSITSIRNMRILVFSSPENISAAAKAAQTYQLEKNNSFLYNITPEIQYKLAEHADVCFFATSGMRYDEKRMPFVSVALKENIPMYIVCVSKGSEIPQEVIDTLRKMQ